MQLLGQALDAGGPGVFRRCMDPIENAGYFSNRYVSLLEGYPNILGYTLPETNSSHLKHLGLEDEFPFGKASWQVYLNI